MKHIRLFLFLTASGLAGVPLLNAQPYQGTTITVAQAGPQKSSLANPNAETALRALKVR